MFKIIISLLLNAFTAQRLLTRHTQGEIMSETPENEVPERIEPSDDGTSAGEETASMTFGAKAIGIFLDPGRVTSHLSQKPDWLFPLIVVVIAAALFNFFASDAIIGIAEEKAIESMQNRNMSTEQIDQAIEIQGKFMKPEFMVVQGALGVVIVQLIMALLFLFLGNIIFGGNKKFKHYWSLVVYVGLIGAVGMLVQGALVRMTGDMNSAQLGLGIITAGDPDAKIHKIFQLITVFGVWEWIVYGIGIASFTGVTRGKAIGTIIAVALVFSVGFGLIS